MSFHTLSLADAMTVAGRMREWDRRAVAAVMGPVSAEVFAVNRWQTDGAAWSLYQGGEPVIVGGISLPNAWTGCWWMVATDGVSRQSWRKLMRHTRTVLANVTNPAFESYRHRIEAYTVGGWREAERLVEQLGFTCEGVRRSAGMGGEDIKAWSIVGPVKGSR